MIDLEELACRVEGLTTSDNTLDVLVEVALFEPDGEYADIRPNHAGTKVIYTDWDGGEETCWAPDWTFDAPARERVAAALRARKETTHG